MDALETLTDANLAELEALEDYGYGETENVS